MTRNKTDFCTEDVTESMIEKELDEEKSAVFIDLD